jgi:hypothetical protein
MDLAELQSFCGKHYHHESRGLDEVSSVGKWSYATDGVICIRVPRLSGVDKKLGFDPGVLFDKAGSQTEWQAIPAVTVTEHPCEECAGGGHWRDCNYCKGRGCKRCNYDGIVGCTADHPSMMDQCDECLGTGVIKKGDTIMEGTGGPVRLSAVYLDRIKYLPNVMIALPMSEDTRLAARIRFDGGEGLLMPMRL